MPFNPPQSVTREQIKKSHPSYTERLNALTFYRESYDGSGGYAPYLDPITVADTSPDDMIAGTNQDLSERRTHLFRHPRERTKFTRRVMQAYLTNVIRRTIQMIIGFLTKAQPLYQGYPKQVEEWMGWATADGTTWEDFKISEIVPRLLWAGDVAAVLFHEPTPDAETAAQQEEQGGRLQVTIIEPEAIVDWRKDGTGQYVWLKVVETVDLTEPGDETARTVTRIWWHTREGWWYVDDVDEGAQEVSVTASGEYPDGMPIVSWRLGTSGVSLVSGAAATQRELFNVNSLIQEQERETTFAMLAAPEDANEGAKRWTRKVGSDNVWYYPPESSVGPYWMAPPPTVLEHFMRKRETLCQEILEDMGLDFDSTGGQTGMAFQFAMSKIVRMLNVLATSMQRGETQTMERVARELGAPLPDDARCVWPSEFDAKDAEKVMDGLGIILDRVASPTFRVEAQYRMATAGMPDLDESVRGKGRDEIEKAEREAEAQVDTGADEVPGDELEPTEYPEGEGPESAGDGSPDGQAR